MITLAHLDPDALRRQCAAHLQDAAGFLRISQDHEHRAQMFARMAEDVERARADAAATAEPVAVSTGSMFIPAAVAPSEPVEGAGQ